MPELLQHSQPARGRTDLGVASGTGGRARATEIRRRARDDLRHQIGELERELGELFATAFPRKGINFAVPAAGGPRVLGVADLEAVRDALVARLHEARAELSAQVDVEERNRELIEEMVAEPERHRWVRVSNEDIGEPGCRHWHSRPRWGLLGLILGWWRVKLSSGCPLATGRAAPRCRSPDESGPPAGPALGWRGGLASDGRGARRGSPPRPRGKAARPSGRLRDSRGAGCARTNDPRRPGGRSRSSSSWCWLRW